MKNPIIYIAIILFGSITLNAGGPWTLSKSKSYIKFSEWWTVFDQHYTDTGALDPNVTTGIYTSSFYFEYGVTNRLTVTGYIPFLTRNYMNNLRSQTTEEIIVAGEAINKFGDPNIAFKYGLTPAGAKIPIAISLLFGIPLGETAGGSLANLQTGDGEFNQQIRIDVGSGFKLGDSPAYFSAYAGLNNRTQGFSEELLLGLEIGIGLINEKLWINSKLNVLESFQNGDTAETTTSTSIFANNAEFASYGLEANYYLTSKLGISAGFASAFSGKIIAAAPTYSVGVFLDLQ